jgi:hypothetical protein
MGFFTDSLGVELAPNNTMRPFFSKNKGTSRKLAGIVIYSSFVVATYGIINRGNFVASFNNALLFGCFSIVLGFISIAYLYKYPASENKLAKLGLLKKIALIPTFIAMMSFVYWLTMAVGIPLIYTQITGARIIAEAVITEKLPERSGKGCSYRVYLSSKDFKTNTYTCVSQDIWANAKSGDRLIAELRVGTLGTYLSNLHCHAWLRERGR